MAQCAQIERISTSKYADAKRTESTALNPLSSRVKINFAGCGVMKRNQTYKYISVWDDVENRHT